MVQELVEEMHKAGTWNHRVFRRTYNLGQGTEETVLEIHEVHYDENGEIHGITENPTHILCDDVEGLRWTLEKMMESLNKPILDWSDD